jgi:hypothetical protein
LDDKTLKMSTQPLELGAVAASAIPANENGPLTIAVSGPDESGRRDLNPRPPEPHSGSVAIRPCVIPAFFAGLVKGTIQPFGVISGVCGGVW